MTEQPLNPPALPSVTGKLFALVLFRLEDAHELSVKGHASGLDIGQITNTLGRLKSKLEEIATLIETIKVIGNQA